MTLQCSNELPSGFWRVHYRIKERLPIGTGQHHALVFIKHPPRTFIRKIASCQSTHSHRALDELLCRYRYAQLNPFFLELARRRTARWCGHESILSIKKVRRLTVHFKGFPRDRSALAGPEGVTPSANGSCRRVKARLVCPSRIESCERGSRPSWRQPMTQLNTLDAARGSRLRPTREENRTELLARQAGRKVAACATIVPAVWRRVVAEPRRDTSAAAS